MTVAQMKAWWTFDGTSTTVPDHAGHCNGQLDPLGAQRTPLDVGVTDC